MNLEVANEERFRSASGVVSGSFVAEEDSLTNHDSHDQNFNLVVDTGFEGLLSTSNKPNTSAPDNTLEDQGKDDLTAPTTLQVEWEIGTFPNEKGASVPERFFPKWAWPSVGDRAWVNGHWVFDCGHPKQVGPLEDIADLFLLEEHFKSEIHPPRAVAAMRRQARPVPGSGTTPVPVTATDLHIHGRAGFVTDMLYCGMDITINGVDGSGDPDACPTKTSPIAETFEFDICLPPRPAVGARLAWSVEQGPGNTVAGHDPEIQETRDFEIVARCENDGDPSTQLYDLGSALHVVVDLSDSGIEDTATYTRRIAAGWVHPPEPPLRHVNLSIDRMNLHDSGDGGIIASDDGEVTFWWANLDRAPEAWLRFADHAPVAGNGNSEMNDYDAGGFGDSFMDFEGANFDLYLLEGENLHLRTSGYDQDCYDNFYGSHQFAVTPYLLCAADVHETSGSDRIDNLDVRLVWPDLALALPGIPGDPELDFGDCDGIDPVTGLGECVLTSPPKPRFLPGSGIVYRPAFELSVALTEFAIAVEDSADLQVTKSCVAEREVPLLNDPITCTIEVTNPGPGLPRNVDLIDVVGTVPGDVIVTDATYVRTGAFGPFLCPETAPGEVHCSVTTIPVGTSVTATVVLVPQRAGEITDVASVRTDSIDPDTNNNSAEERQDVFQPIDLVLNTGGKAKPIRSSSKGVVPVSILTTADLDASTIDPLSVCFGAADDPPQRDCSEEHGKGHFKDVDGDGDVDLVLHFEARETGLAPGDQTACVTGRTTAGIGIYGCGAVRVR